MGFKTAMAQLTNWQKVGLMFASAILPPLVAYFTAPDPVPSVRILVGAILGGVLVFVEKMLDDTPTD